MARCNGGTMATRRTSCRDARSDPSAPERVSLIGTRTAPRPLIRARSHRAAVQTPHEWPQPTRRRNTTKCPCHAGAIRKRAEAWAGRTPGFASTRWMMPFGCAEGPGSSTRISATGSPVRGSRSPCWTRRGRSPWTAGALEGQPHDRTAMAVPDLRMGQSPAFGTGSAARAGYGRWIGFHTGERPHSPPGGRATVEALQGPGPRAAA